MRIVLDIDELTLHGFAASDRHAIGDAVQRRLAQLLGATPPGRLASIGAAASLAAPRIVPQPTPGATGEAIAGAVHTALAGRQG